MSARVARGQQECGQGQRISIHDPLQVRKTRVQRPLDIRQGDVHDRDIQQQHERAQAHRDQRPPLVSALTRILAAIFGLLATAVLILPGQIRMGFGHEGSL
jgi:hypothetical protein